MFSRFICFIALLIGANSVIAQDKLGFTGVFGAYYISSLPNLDDKNADQRLDFVSTMKWAAGIEKATWFNDNFGIGAQASFWNAGQDYKGADTFAKTTFTGSTNITYTKLGLYLYHKSFNRYKPDARFRFLSYFGPYAALNVGYNDQQTVKNNVGVITQQTSFVPAGTQNNLDKDKLTMELKEPLYNTFDFGFTFAPGFQLMLTPKLALGFNVRADLGASNVENQRDLRKITLITPYEESYDYWNNLSSKYNSLSSIEKVLKDNYDRRPATFNTSYGASITLRMYSAPQFDKR